MSFSRFPKPDWALVIPWGAVAVMSVTGGFYLSSLREEIAEIEARNVAVYQEAGRDLRNAFAKDGWEKAWTCLETVLPEMVAVGGPSHELREVAVTALTRQCSSWLPDPCEQSPVFSADSRWLIQRLANGSLAFTDVHQTNDSTFVFRTTADDVRMHGDYIYYPSAKSWWRILLQSSVNGHGAISPPESADAPAPASHDRSFAINPKLPKASQKKFLQLADGTEVPVHADRKQEPKPYSVVLSPDGRFAALWTEGLWVKIWRLDVLRQHLTRLGLDWNIPPFPLATYPQTITGRLSGTEELPPRGIHLPIMPLPEPPKTYSAHGVASSSITSHSLLGAPRRKVHLPSLPASGVKSK